MSPTPLDQALDRAERALLRIERSAATAPNGGNASRDTALRRQVAVVVAELDDLIRQSGPQG